MKEITGKKQVKINRQAETQFKNGVSGNPNGRPKGARDFKTIVKDALTSISKKQREIAEQKGLKYVEQDWESLIIEKCISEAINGKDKARDAFMKYRFSLPKQEIGLSGSIENKLTLQEQQMLEEMKRKLGK